MTRTLCIGPVPSKLEEIYGTVLAAQLAAEREIQPGMTGADADAIARQSLARAGLGEAFVHGTGHGIGLEVHEPPWLTPSRGELVLEPGMVFSVEPGVYLPDWGGVRIEDLVLLGPSGCEVLSRSPKLCGISEVQHMLARPRPG
jgi:Xaa-Pro aminopeptidase